MVTRQQIDAIAMKWQSVQAARAQEAMRSQEPEVRRMVYVADYVGIVPEDELRDLWLRYVAWMERKADLDNLEHGTELYRRLNQMQADEGEAILETLETWDARKAEAVGNTKA